MRRQLGRRRLALLGAAAVAIAMGVTACGGESGSSNNSAQTSERLFPKSTCDLKGKTVGIASPGSVALLNQLYSDIKEFSAKSGGGLKFTISNAEFDPATHVLNAQQMLGQGVNLLYAIPTTGEGWDQVAKQAKGANIPFINHSTFPLEDAAQSITIWHQMAGQVAAKSVAKWIEERKFSSPEVGLLVSLQDANMQARTNAFRDELQKLVPSVNFVAREPVEQDQEKAAKSVANMIQAHPSMKVVFSPIGEGALGAERAAQEAGKKTSDFFIASVDGGADQLNLIKKGSTLQATADIDWRFDAGNIVHDMEQLLCKEKVSPLRLMLPTLVTAQNVDQTMAVEKDPFNPQNKQRFQEITKYFDTKWTKNTPLPTPSGS